MATGAKVLRAKSRPRVTRWPFSRLFRTGFWRSSWRDGMWKLLFGKQPIPTFAAPRGRRNRYAIQTPLFSEALEPRVLLTASATYVNDWTFADVTMDQGTIGVLDAGDQVTTNEGDGATATYGIDAFNTIQQGINNVSPSGQVYVFPAAADYSTEDVDINVNNATLFLEGNVGIKSLQDSGTGTSVNILDGHALTITDTGNRSFDGSFVSGTSNATINKEGGGIWTLTGNSASFTGTINVDSGTVVAQNNNAVGSGSSAASSPVVIGSGAELDIDGVTANKRINLTDGGTLKGLNTARSNGVLTISGSTVDIAATGTFTLGDQTNDLTGVSSTTIDVTGGGNVALNNSSNLTSSAKWDVDGTTLKAAADADFGTAPASAVGNYFTLRNGGILDPTGIGTLDSRRGVTLAGTTGGTIDVITGATSYAGTVSGSSLQLTKDGAGTLVLSGTNTYTGATNVATGTLELGASNVIDDHSSLIVAGIFDLNGNSEAVNGLSGSGSITSGVAGSVTLTTGSFNLGGDFSAAITNGSGTVNVDKQGTSSQTLSGTNSYSTTSVGAGTLLITGSTTSSASAIGGTLLVDGTLVGNAVVTSPGTLGGSGTIQGNVSGTGTVAPGDSPGTLTINGNFTPTGSVALELDGTTAGTLFDQLVVSGTVDLSGATLSPTIGYYAAMNDQYLVVNKTSAGAIVPFSSYGEGSPITIGEFSAIVSYQGGDGNDLLLTVVAPSQVWVNDNWAITTDTGPVGLSPGDIVAATAVGDLPVSGKVYGYNAFSTIQAGIDAVGSGGAVNVNVGKYIENITINKSVSLLGPNAGLSGDAMARGAEAVLYTAVNDSNDTTIINLQASNVTISGLKIDGDNPYMAGGTMVGLADVNAAEGIQNSAFGRRPIRRDRPYQHQRRRLH